MNKQFRSASTVFTTGSCLGKTLMKTIIIMLHYSSKLKHSLYSYDYHNTKCPFYTVPEQGRFITYEN